MKHLGVFDSYNVRRHMRPEPEPPVSFAKSVIAGVVMAVFCLGVLAFCTAHARAATMDDATCAAAGKAGASIMQARQNGVPLNLLLDALPKASKPSEEAVVKLIRVFVIVAYARPRFELPENRQLAVTEFSNTVQIACLKNTLQ